MAVNLDVGFNPNGGPLLKFIEDAAAHWRKHFDGVGMGIDTSILKVVQSSVAAAKTVAANEEATHKQAVDSANRAASLKAKAEQDYVALKSKYVLQGLDVTRQAIHEEEQEIKKTRDAINRATQENLGKETTAVLKAERDKQNARLQGLRSVEKEITGARTFSEQLEKNVYEPIKKEAAKGGAITALLFGEVGTLQKKLKETESQVKAHEEQITAHAKEASAKIEAQEHEHATKLKALEDQIATAKSAEAKKELEAVKTSIQEQIAEERKLTQAAAAEEQLRLQHHQAALEKELSETKAEHAKASSGGEGKGGGAGSALMQGAGIGAAVEGLTVLVEKSKEVSEANRALIAGTHETGEALEREKKNAEDVANELGKTGAEVQTAMGHTAAWTHATGDELKKQTEAVVAFEAVHGISAEKLMKTEEGRAKVFAEAAQNIAGAQMAAQDPALQAELAQKNVMEMVGKLANVLLTALAPILKQVSPLLQELGEIAASVLTPALSIVGPILEMIVTGLNFLMPIMKPLIVVVGLLTAGIAAMNIVMLVNPFVIIAVAAVALIGIIVTMVKHWDDVVKTMKKVFTAIADAGGAVLSFLGITGKAEAATKKHTESIEANKKALDEAKKSVADISSEYEKYTDELKKNQDEQDKSAKDTQDRAIASIVDIKRQLKTATGEQKKTLEERLAQNIAAGKAAVAAQESLQKEQHDAALSFGAASDADKKKGKDNSAKIDKDAYTAEKNAEDIRFGSDQLILERQLAAKAITKEQFDAKNEDAETLHVQKLNDIASKHRKGHEADAQKAEEALLKIKIAANDKIIKAEADKLKKLEEAHEKEITLQEERDKIQAEIDDAASQARIAGITDETAKAIAEEEARYDKQLTEKAHELGDMKTGQALAESFEANHQNKLTAIVKNAEEERRKKHRETLNEITGASKVYDQAQQAIHAKFFAPILDNWKNQKTFAMQALATIGESFINYIEQWVAKQAEALAAQVADSLISTATTTTAATAAATAWAPAALSASVATFGGADATGLAAYTSAMAAGQAVGHMADGGFVGGIGGERDDRNPRMLSRTEFVVNGRQAPKWAPVLHAINNGAEPNFGGGGRTFMLDERQVQRLEKHTVLSSQRMLLDNQKTQQQRSRSRI